MKQSIVLVGGLLAAFATSAEAQKAPLSLRKGAQANPVKRAYQPHSAVTLPPAPLVGGSDSCTTPDAISGTGSFTFDNSAATTGAEGQTEALCNIFTLTGIDNDVWFVWTAPTTGMAVVVTCNLTGDDTKIAAYAGAVCPTPGTALACSDDDCLSGLQSRMLFPVTGGNAYMLQVGNFPSALGGVGQFNISIQVPLANDDCSTPQTVTGFGRFPFDNTLATTGAQGQTEPLCNFFGGIAINNDMWFTWVAPLTGTFAVVTEGLTDVDTKIAVYNGVGCPAAAAIGCNDDGGFADLQTITVFAATAGNSYTIQLGLYAFSTFTGSGQFAIMSTTPRPEDNCATPAAIFGQGLFPFDNVFSTAGAQGQTEALCNLVGQPNFDSDSWYLWTPDATGTATITTCPTTFMDTKIGLYNGPTCPAAGSALVCEEDTCGWNGFQAEVSLSVSCGQTYLIQVGSYPYGGQDGGLGDLDISIVGGPCPTPTTPFCLGDGTGAPCPCGNNATLAGHGCGTTGFPGGALLTSTGIASDETTGTDTLVMTASDISGPALFIQSSGTGLFNFGDGHLCAAFGIIRLGVVFPSGGTASYPGGLTPNEIHIQGLAVSGDVRHYQAWYRSVPALCNPGVQNYNLTQGLTLTWGP